MRQEAHEQGEHRQPMEADAICSGSVARPVSDLLRSLSLQMAGAEPFPEFAVCESEHTFGFRDLNAYPKGGGLQVVLERFVRQRFP